MGDTSMTDAPREAIDDEILNHDVTDDALEAAAGSPRQFTAMITDCPTLVAACCGGR